jgi:hypothetical protein
MVAEALQGAKGNPRTGFDDLYHSMKAVARFGRLARFEYLTMLAKLGLAGISPGSPYLDGSSGPLRGAEILFGCKERVAILDSWIVELDEQLRVGMQVLEDALRNWQKSPARFVPFRG